MNWIIKPEDEENDLVSNLGICVIRYCSSKDNCATYNCVVLLGPR